MLLSYNNHGDMVKTSKGHFQNVHLLWWPWAPLRLPVCRQVLVACTALMNDSRFTEYGLRWVADLTWYYPVSLIGLLEFPAQLSKKNRVNVIAVFMCLSVHLSLQACWPIPIKFWQRQKLQGITFLQDDLKCVGYKEPSNTSSK